MPLPQIKYFCCRVSALEKEVNDWIAETGNTILNGSLIHSGNDYIYVAVYQIPEDREDEHCFTGSVIAREVEKKVDGHVEIDYCMAGAFPVPEMWALSPEDSDTAPLVLMSPDFDPTNYAEWFCLPGVPLNVRNRERTK